MDYISITKPPVHCLRRLKCSFLAPGGARPGRRAGLSVSRATYRRVSAASRAYLERRNGAVDPYRRQPTRLVATLPRQPKVRESEGLSNALEAGA